jgi:hypothetical protein
MIETSTIITGVFVVIVFLIIERTRTLLRLDNVTVRLHASNVVPIAVVIVGLNNLPQFFAVERDNPYDLVEAGLSSSNLLSIVSSGFVAICSAYLLVAKKTLSRNVFSGASFWVMTLFMVYAASTSWSIFPLGTAFRAVEIIAYYIVAVFIFSAKDTLRNLYWIMLLHMSLGAIPLLSNGMAVLRDGLYYGFLQSNQYSLYAAVFLLLHYYMHRSNMLGYVYGLVLFVAFGSTATAAAFLAAVITYLIYRNPKGLSYALRLPVCVTVISFCILSIFFPEHFGGIFEFVGPIVQKDVEHFYTATGRTVIWKVYFESLINVPFGIGFYSERVFLDPFVGAEWIAPNAHNGFISAWIGAGFPALFCLLGIYMSIIMHLRHQNNSARRICNSLLIMLFINSMTYPGIGGYFTMWYFVLAAIVVLANTPTANSGEVPLFAGRLRIRPRMPGQPPFVGKRRYPTETGTTTHVPGPS